MPTARGGLAYRYTKRGHVANRSRSFGPDLADLLLAAAAAALRRLGQSERTATTAGAWRARSLPQLGLGRHPAASALAHSRARFARPWRQPMVARRQLLDSGLRLRLGAADPSAETGAGDDCRAFPRW